MLSHLQFFQLKKLLQNNLHEITCPCGVNFYSYSSRAVYHSNACRQRFFRLKQSEYVDFEEIPKEISPDQEKEQKKGQENNTLIFLKEKENIYNNKLKAI